MSKKTYYNFITVLLLIGILGLVIGMAKTYQLECTKQGGVTKVAKVNVRGISMECKK